MIKINDTVWILGSEYMVVNMRFQNSQARVARKSGYRSDYDNRWLPLEMMDKKERKDLVVGNVVIYLSSRTGVKWIVRVVGGYGVQLTRTTDGSRHRAVVDTNRLKKVEEVENMEKTKMTQLQEFTLVKFRDGGHGLIMMGSSDVKKVYYKSGDNTMNYRKNYKGFKHKYNNDQDIVAYHYRIASLATLISYVMGGLTVPTHWTWKHTGLSKIAIEFEGHKFEISHESAVAIKEMLMKLV